MQNFFMVCATCLENGSVTMVIDGDTGDIKVNCNVCKKEETHKPIKMTKEARDTTPN